MIPKEAAAKTASIDPLAINWWKGVQCAAHIGAFFLAANPVLYFVVDGAIDVVAGLVDGSGQEIATGVVKAGIGGVVKVVTKKAGAKAATKAIAGLVVLNVGYNIYKEGVVGGLGKTVSDLVPDSCKELTK